MKNITDVTILESLTDEQLQNLIDDATKFLSQRTSTLKRKLLDRINEVIDFTQMNLRNEQLPNIYVQRETAKNLELNEMLNLVNNNFDNLEEQLEVKLFELKLEHDALQENSLIAYNKILNIQLEAKIEIVEGLIKTFKSLKAEEDA